MDEAALIHAAQADPAAFDALYQRYLLRVYRYMRARTGNDEDAADLTQHVFLQTLRALPNYQQRGMPFAAWLFRIAHNTVTDAYRRKRSAISWETLPEGLQLPTEYGPEAMTLQLERLTHLQQLLMQLDPFKRELLALRFAAGLSAPEIALVVGKSHAAVKKQITRTLQTLKEHYHEE